MLRKYSVILLILLALLLAACGGGNEASSEETAVPEADTAVNEENAAADEAEPTTEPTAEPTTAPTEVPDPTADFESLSSERLGITIGHPPTWVTEVVEESGELRLVSDAALMDADSALVLDGAMVLATALDQELLGFLGEEVDTSDPVAMLELFTGLLGGEGEEEEFSVLEAPSATTIDGQDAAIGVYQVTGPDQSGIAVFAAILHEARVVFAFGATTDAVADEYRPIIEAMLNSVELSTPVVAEVEPEPTVAPMTPTPTPEPTEAAAESEPEEAAEEEAESEGDEAEAGGEETAVVAPALGIPVFALFDDVPTADLESGWTMYSNANIVNDVAYYDGVLWAATDGGMVGWDAANGELLRKWTTLDGMPHNVVNAIIACPLGGDKLALGTEAGLSLYDPNAGTFENFTVENSGLHSEAGVASLACVPNLGTLVIGYNLDGVEVYDYANDTGTHYEPFDQLESGFAEALGVVGDLEEIWVAHIAGISVIRADGTISYYDDENSTLDDPDTDDFEHFVNDIAVDANGVVWLGRGGGLTRIDGDDAFTFFHGDDVPGWPFFTNVEGLAAAADGTIYTNAGFGGVCHFDPAAVSCLETYEDEDGMAEDFNSDIIVGEDGNLYYASEEGVSRFDGSAWQMWTLDELPQANTYRAIAQGADGSIWVGGFYGAQRFFAYDADSSWTSLDDHLSFATINTFYPTGDGMWVGHSGGASFYTFADESWTDLERAEEPETGIYSGDVTAIEYDSQGRIWFGTSSGLTVWTGDDFFFFDLLTDEEREEERSPRWVYDFLVDGNTMWVGSAGALFHFDAGTEIVEMARYDEENSNLPWVPSVRALAYDVDGNLMVAADSSLFQYNGADDFDEVLDADYNINGMILDNVSDTLWLSLNGGGVLALENGEWINLTTADGLPSNLIVGSGVLVDYLGSLWIAAGEGGLLRFVP